MDNISEYDQRQLQLMLDRLLSFRKKEIELSSLIGTLEFLLSSLEVVENDWEQNFLDHLTILETINAIEIAESAGENIQTIENKQKAQLIEDALFNLKKIIEKKYRNSLPN